MTNGLIEKGLKRVALVDDVEDDTVSDRILLRRYGFEPTYIRGAFREVDELVERVCAEADFVICDNTLQQHNRYANFPGAKAVARWYERGFPAVLVTQYEQDLAVSIRSYGSKIPRTLKKIEVVGLEPIEEVVNLCLGEFRGIFTAEREPCRTMVEIARVDKLRGEVYGRIMSWDYERPVPFPMETIPLDLQAELAEGMYYTALVNTGAANMNDIYLTDFQAAPDPISEDEIG